ncbi:MAG: Gfo/Idh/MocA family oxidoreductase [Bacteroidales bacterium]
MISTRREFLTAVSALAAGMAITSPLGAIMPHGKKLKIALVGTGIRGVTFWGERLISQYPDLLEFVGLCDINPGRLKYAAEYMKVDCELFTDFEKMISKTGPDLVIVTTIDSTHQEFIIKAMKMGCDVMTEKPMAIDEDKTQAILDAETRYGKKVIVGFNYRWSPYFTKIKELISQDAIGELMSVDFSWMLNNFHGAQYFRRWHGERDKSGTLLVHKSTHHFDLLNWWIDSEPYEVFGYGALDHYGSNNSFRGKNCRDCNHTKECRYYWDITRKERDMKLYVENEKYDGYIRDNCLFRHEINIYDKMSVQAKYMNGVNLNYSLTTQSPYEGLKIALNGRNGRIEAWLDIPHLEENAVSQSEMHSMEMAQDIEEYDYRPIIVHRNWEDYEKLMIKVEKSGHGGGDKRLQDRLFTDSKADPDPLNHMAGSRDGAMSVLIGIAARKSIETGKPIRIAELTSLEPRVKRLLG